MAFTECCPHCRPSGSKNLVETQMEIPEEKLVDYTEYRWSMYDGEKFNRVIKDTYNEPIPDEYLDDIISFGNAMVIWEDAFGCQIAYLRAHEISFKYVINSILYHYKRTRTTPQKVCILEGIYYNPFDRVIRVVFGS